MNEMNTVIAETNISHDHCSYYLRACCRGMCDHTDSPKPPKPFPNGPFGKPFLYEVVIRRRQGRRRANDCLSFESMADATRYALAEALRLRELIAAGQDYPAMNIYEPDEWRRGTLISYQIYHDGVSIRASCSVAVHIKRKERTHG